MGDRCYIQVHCLEKDINKVADCFGCEVSEFEELGEITDSPFNFGGKTVVFSMDEVNYGGVDAIDKMAVEDAEEGFPIPFIVHNQPGDTYGEGVAFFFPGETEAPVCFEGDPFEGPYIRAKQANGSNIDKILSDYRILEKYLIPS